MLSLVKRLLILGAVLIAFPNIAFAQTCIGTPPLTQIIVDNTINICLPTNNANEISALALRQVLQTMTSAIFNLSPVTGFINQFTSLSGAAALNNLNTFAVTSDTEQCAFCTNINSTWNYGSGTVRGARVNIFGWNIQTTPNSGVGQTTVGLGVEGIGQTNSGDGGGSGTEAGTYFGGNFIGACTLFVYECAGAEIDIRTDSAYRGHYTIGLPVVNVESHQATGLDAAFAIYSGGFEAAAGGGGPWGPGVGFHFGLAFSELGNNGQVPIDSTGTLIGGHVEALSVIPVAYGFDANLFSFSSYYLRCCNLTNKFTVDGSGNIVTMGSFTIGSGTNIIPMVPNPAAGLDIGGELRELDNGLQGISAAAIQAQGSGYGNTLTGTMTWSGTGCSVNPVLNVSSNSGGQIVAVNSITTVGVCAFQSFPSPIATTWTPGGGLNAGTGAAFILDPVITSVFGCSHADGTSRCYASDSPQTGAFNLFNLLVNGGMNWGSGSAPTDVSMIRGGVGLLEVNASAAAGFYINLGMLRGAIGTATTIASGACGTGTNGTVVGTNQSGVITIGAVATTSCTISFSTTLFAAPGCVFSPGNAAAAAQGTTLANVNTPSTAAWIISGSALANTVYSYVCL